MHLTPLRVEAIHSLTEAQWTELFKGLASVLLKFGLPASLRNNILEQLVPEPDASKRRAMGNVLLACYTELPSFATRGASYAQIENCVRITPFNLLAVIERCAKEPGEIVINLAKKTKRTSRKPRTPEQRARETELARERRRMAAGGKERDVSKLQMVFEPHRLYQAALEVRKEDDAELERLRRIEQTQHENLLRDQARGSMFD